MTQSRPGSTRELVSQVRELRFAELPTVAVEVVKHCLLDWLGVTLAGSREPLVRMLREELVDELDREPGGGASLIGHAERCSPMTAALINGAASHALDFDDTHSLMNGHPSVPVLPAVLALAEQEGSEGEALVTAFVAGVELECRLGALLNPSHYRAGFHATGTLGTLGAAAACAHLLGLDEEGWLLALGLAGTQASGLKASFGTMAKPLHAGRAATNGLLSARLAARGFTAHREIVEAPQGLLETLAGGTPDGDRLAELRGRFLILDTLFKYHAACYLTHSAIEGALALRRGLGADPGAALARLERVEVRVAPAALSVCNLERPTSGLEGKFSLRATTAMALLGDDTSDLAAYNDRRMKDAELVDLRERVEVVAVEGTSPTCSTVTIEVAGERRQAAVEVGRPSDDLARQWERLSRKFTPLSAAVLGSGGSAAVREAVTRIEDLAHTADLLALCRPPKSTGTRAPRPRAAPHRG